MMWDIFSRDGDNISPWYVVRKSDGLKYPSNIPGQRPIEYEYYRDAENIRDRLNSEIDNEKKEECKIEDSIQYDLITISLYKSMLKLKINDLIKESLKDDIKNIDYLQQMFDKIDTLSSIEDFEDIVNNLLKL